MTRVPAAAGSLRILVPLDGSTDAESILAAVLPLAERRPLRLTLLSTISRSFPRDAAESYLKRAQRAVERHDVQVRWESCLEEPASAVLSHAVSDRADLIAMATHGRTGVKRFLMGSVTEKVLRQAPFPLLTCRPGSRMEGWAHVATLDGSERAETILQDLLPLTRLVGSTLHLLQVRPDAPTAEARRYLAGIARRCAEAGVNAVPAFRQGPPSPQILRYALEVRAGLIAMSTHGRTGIDRVLMGSVAEEVLRKSGCPLLLRREAHRMSGLAAVP